MRLKPLLALTFCVAARTTAAASPQSAPAATQTIQNSDIFGHPLPAQKQVRVYGQRIAFYDMGHAATPGQPVLVLLHGYGSQADVDFGPSLPLLAKHRRVIALDQIGAGRSDKPYISYHVETYVQWLGEFLRTLGITRFDLAGESLGGWTAARYTEEALRPGSDLPRPQRLILVDADGFEAPTGPLPPWHMTVSTVDETQTGLRAVFARKDLVTPEVAKRRFISKLQANDAFAASTFSTNPEVRNEAAGPQASTITIPTWVVWGADDTVIPNAMGSGYAHAIPGARMIFIEHTGHVPPLESPSGFVKVVESFLQ